MARKSAVFGAHNLIHGLKALILAGRGFPRGRGFEKGLILNG